jgi:hypothetical protein
MDVVFEVLNKPHSFEDVDEFEMTQLENGEWEIEIGTEVVYRGDFSPFRISVTE